MILNRTELKNFIDKIGGAGKKSNKLFSYSQEISENDFFSLKRNLLGNKNLLFYSNHPAEKFSFLAFQKIYSVLKNSAEEINTLEKDISELPFGIICNTDDSLIPLFAGGMKFPSGKKDAQWEEFNQTEWSIPRLIAANVDGNYRLTINFFDGEIDTALDEAENYLSFKEPDGNVDKNSILSRRSSGFWEWEEQIEKALLKISGNEIKKVVVSRFNILELKNKPRLFPLIRKLESVYENCTIFIYRSGGSLFFGATPEKLFKAKNGYIECTALAGSIRRGGDQKEDLRLENELLNDHKNLSEHKSVADYIYSNIEPLAEKIEAPAGPVIKKFANIQHLYTPISGKLKPGISFFAALEKLFPTPAVCGNPKREAVSLINSLEKFDRGMFAGVVGWFNLKGAADFSVGIRAAYLRENILIAYAGCGIVAGSDAESEFNETNLKLKPILNLFADETFD